MILNQQIVVHSVDGVTEYPDVQTFLNSLGDHLKIQTQLPANLAMLSVGKDAPDQQYQDIPWLELDESNNPLALKYYNGAEWAETRPYKTIQAPYEGMYIQYGQISITHVQAATDTWIDTMALQQPGGTIGQFLFGEPFKAGTSVHVQITPVKSAVHRDKPLVSGDIDNDTKKSDWILDRSDFEWTLGNSVDNKGFNVLMKTADANSQGLSFTFNWMAIGEKA